ncbi:hypothetical protein, partial [Escherichia coli]|uniref:hypothetical protein n=1 Tax=Escherichia coli TaxID=562 RepID=UPI0019569018
VERRDGVSLPRFVKRNANTLPVEWRLVEEQLDEMRRSSRGLVRNLGLGRAPVSRGKELN